VIGAVGHRQREVGVPYWACPNTRCGLRQLIPGGVLTVVVWLPAARPATNALEIGPARAKPGHLAQRHCQAGRDRDRADADPVMFEPR
jgi:hypothetical protein